MLKVWLTNFRQRFAAIYVKRLLAYNVPHAQQCAEACSTPLLSLFPAGMFCALNISSYKTSMSFIAGVSVNPIKNGESSSSNGMLSSFS